MAAAPVPTPDGGLIDWVMSHLDNAAAAVFGGGVVWGTSHATQADHARRITALEANRSSDIARLESKIDGNHSQLVTLIVGLASGKTDN